MMSRIPVDTVTARKLVELLRDHNVALLPSVRHYAASLIEGLIENGHAMSIANKDALFDELEALFGRE